MRANASLTLPPREELAAAPIRGQNRAMPTLDRETLMSTMLPLLDRVVRRPMAYPGQAESVEHWVRTAYCLGPDQGELAEHAPALHVEAYENSLLEPGEPAARLQDCLATTPTLPQFLKAVQDVRHSDYGGSCRGDWFDSHAIICLSPEVNIELEKKLSAEANLPAGQRVSPTLLLASLLDRRNPVFAVVPNEELASPLFGWFRKQLAERSLNVARNPGSVGELATKLAEGLGLMGMKSEKHPSETTTVPSAIAHGEGVVPAWLWSLSRLQQSVGYSLVCLISADRFDGFKQYWVHLCDSVDCDADINIDQTIERLLSVNQGDGQRTERDACLPYFSFLEQDSWAADGSDRLRVALNEMAISQRYASRSIRTLCRSSEVAETLDGIEIGDGDVVVSLEGPKALQAIPPEDFVFYRRDKPEAKQSKLAILRKVDDPPFFSWMLRETRVEQTLRFVGLGSINEPRVSLDDLLDAPMPWPDAEERRRLESERDGTLQEMRDFKDEFENSVESVTEVAEELCEQANDDDFVLSPLRIDDAFDGAFNSIKDLVDNLPAPLRASLVEHLGGERGGPSEPLQEDLEWPTPIARLLVRAQRVDLDPYKKLDLRLKTAERLAQLDFFVCLAALRALRVDAALGVIRDTLMPAERPDQRMAFGSWVAASQSVRVALQAQARTTAINDDLLIDRCLDPDVKQLNKVLQEAAALRNRTLGHGNPGAEQTDRENEAAATALLGRVSDQLRYLADVDLCVVDRVTRQRGGVQLHYRAFRGDVSEPVPVDQLVELSSAKARLLSGEVYARVRSGDFFSLHPFLTCRPSPLAKVDTLWAVDGVLGRKRKLVLQSLTGDDDKVEAMTPEDLLTATGDFRL